MSLRGRGSPSSSSARTTWRGPSATAANDRRSTGEVPAKYRRGTVLAESPADSLTRQVLAECLVFLAHGSLLARAAARACYPPPPPPLAALVWRLQQREAEREHAEDSERSRARERRARA